MNNMNRWFEIQFISTEDFFQMDSYQLKKFSNFYKFKKEKYSCAFLVDNGAIIMTLSPSICKENFDEIAVRKKIDLSNTRIPDRRAFSFATYIRPADYASTKQFIKVSADKSYNCYYLTDKEHFSAVFQCMYNCYCIDIPLKLINPKNKINS